MYVLQFWGKKTELWDISAKFSDKKLQLLLFGFILLWKRFPYSCNMMLSVVVAKFAFLCTKSMYFSGDGTVCTFVYVVFCRAVCQDPHALLFVWVACLFCCHSISEIWELWERERERDGQSEVSALCQREQAWREVNFNESSMNRRVLWGKSVCDRIRRCRDSLKDTIPRLSRSLCLSVSLAYSYIILCLAPCRGQVPEKKWFYGNTNVLCGTKWLAFLLTLILWCPYYSIFIHLSTE